MSHGAATDSLAEDLTRNRAGHLSSAQRGVLEKAAPVRFTTGAVWLGLLVTLTTLIMATMAMVSEWRHEASDMKAALIGGVLILACNLGLVWMLVRGAQRRAALRTDIADGNVVAFLGRVVWTTRFFNNNYVLEPVDGSLAVHARSAPLPPGPYRAYVLPRSRVVVAAESTAFPGGVWSISLANPKEVGLYLDSGPGLGSALAQPFPVAPHIGDRAEVLRALAHALDFNAEDLGHNRRGTMSPRQVRRRLASAVVPFMFIIWIGLLSVLSTGLIDRYSTLLFAAPVLLATLICLWLRRDIFTRHVQFVEGVVERYVPANVIETMAISDSNDYYRSLLVRGYKIPVRESPFRAVVPTLRYRLYLAKSTGRVLSAEPLDTSSAQPHGASRPGANWKAV
ncbi:hypothetical protein [Sorangium sp. So ce388]|uniref:hypothetical protein n=1 Tax=Sorangium sp. So ce388 TaxID=3133309 RepID=UPI003F5C07A9